MIGSTHQRPLAMARRASAVVCVLLVLFIGFVAAVHSHPDNSSSSERACSVCVLAHSGVIPVALGAPIPVFTSYPLYVTRAHSPRSLLFVSSLYIRPPPVV